MSAEPAHDPTPYSRLTIYRSHLPEALRMAAAVAEASTLSVRTLTVKCDDAGFWVVEMFIASIPVADYVTLLEGA